MAAEGLGIADNDEFHAGTGHGYVHATQVGEEAYLTMVVGSDEADDNHVALLPLKGVDGVDGHGAAYALQLGRGVDDLAEILHLGAVGGDDAEVYVFVVYAAVAYAGGIRPC